MKAGNHPDAFSAYESEVAAGIGAVAEEVKRISSEKKNLSLEAYPFRKVERELLPVIRGVLGGGGDSLPEGLSLQSPPAHVTGDFAIGTFPFAKSAGRPPQEIAMKIAEAINSADLEFIEGASAQGPFVNVNARKGVLYASILSNIAESGERYGESDQNSGKIAFMDYSSPNIAKPIGVGHLRSTIIGQSLSNLYEKTGYTVIRDNHLGDWGTQFGKLLYAYRLWGDEKNLREDPIGELKNLYVRFHGSSAENPEMEEAARKLFADLENGDPELLALWKRFRELSIADFEKVYRRLGVRFDMFVGESYFVREAGNVVNECLGAGVCRIDPGTGAVVVDDLEGLPSFLLRKQDGSTLYISRDLASLRFRVKTFRPDSILYVVGSEQELNFRQLFALARRIGYLDRSTEAKHIGFGMVTRDGKKMSTRKGTLIELESLMRQSVEKSREILLSKNSDLRPDELAATAETIGIGAVIYNDLRQSRMKNISFDWDRMLDLEGGSAVYLQYTYVRIGSILRKFREAFPGETGNAPEGGAVYLNDSEFALAKKLLLFPAVIANAQETDSPHDICTYLEELALSFNSFYNETSIMKTDDPALRSSRIVLIGSVAKVIRNGLALLSVGVPDRM